MEHELIYLKAAIRLTKKNDKTHGVTKIESHKKLTRLHKSQWK
jgi:hypothetical protein